MATTLENKRLEAKRLQAKNLVGASVLKDAAKVQSEIPEKQPAANEDETFSFNLNPIDPTGARITGGLAVGTSGIPLGPVAMLGASALGAEGAGQAAELFNKFVAGAKDTQTPFERSLNAAMNIVTDMTLGGIGGRFQEAVRKGASKFFRSPVNKEAGVTTEQLAQDFQDLNVQGTAGAFGGPVTKLAEQTTAKAPTSMNIISSSANRTLSDLDEAIFATAKKAGDIKPRNIVGKELQVALKGDAGKLPGKEGFIEKYKGIQERLYDAVKKEIPAKGEVEMSNTTRMIEESLDEVKALSESQSDVVPSKYVRLLNDIRNEVTETVGFVPLGDRAVPLEQTVTSSGSLPWEAVQKFKRRIGDMIGDKRISQDLTNSELRRLYSTLLGDQEAFVLGLEKTSPGVKKAWERASSFTKAFSDRKDKIEKIAEAFTESDSFTKLINGSKKGPEILNAVKKSVLQVDKDAWNDTVGSLIYDMSRTKASQQVGTESDIFSFNTFLTNYAKLNQSGAAKVLFSSPQHKGLKEEMDKLVRVASSLKGSERLANPSGTAGHNAMMQFMQFGLGSAGGFAGGMDSMLASGTATALGPYSFGKLLTNKDFVKWLSKGIQIKPTSFNDMSTHLGRLTGFTSAQPKIRASVREFLKSFDEFNEEQGKIESEPAVN